MSVSDLTSLYPGLLVNQGRLLKLLHNLEHNRPNVLFLEGGSRKEREGLALYWSCLLNCAQENKPCLFCSSCRQIANMAFRDQFVFSGQEQTIKIDQVREAKTIMSQKPDLGQVRIFILSQAQELTQSAANSLLKAMEEPLPDNYFVLLAPQRKLLLPTLVSRSFVLTLSSSNQQYNLEDQGLQGWLQLLLTFWRTGQGLLAESTVQGALDKGLVRQILFKCQQNLLQSAQHNQVKEELSEFLSGTLDSRSWNQVHELLQQAVLALENQVHPALVLEWTAMRIRLLCKDRIQGNKGNI